jgi:hypothetical protein
LVGTPALNLGNLKLIGLKRESLVKSLGENLQELTPEPDCTDELLDHLDFIGCRLWQPASGKKRCNDLVFYF